eukprot:10807103-Karenia_brevis.AAC.1
MKFAIYATMLPKQIQDKLYDLGSNQRGLECEKIRHYIIALAQQRIHMGLPRPVDVNEVQNGGSRGVEEGKGPGHANQNGNPQVRRHPSSRLHPGDSLSQG